MTSETVTLTRDDFSLDAVLESLRSPKAGCVVFFVGTVRESSTQKRARVDRLLVGAYDEMATKMLRRLAERVREKFDLLDVRIVHRLGELRVCENIICVAVSAEHRNQALDACRWLIDELKKEVPIWKREFFAE